MPIPILFSVGSNTQGSTFDQMHAQFASVLIKLAEKYPKQIGFFNVDMRKGSEPGGFLDRVVGPTLQQRKPMSEQSNATPGSEQFLLFESLPTVV